MDGNFTLNVAPNATLVISYIGYKDQEIAVNNKTNIQIKLVEDSQALDEVVVVGYGVQKRASVTGSVASLQAKDIATVKTPNVSNALAGKLPGYVPYKEAVLRVTTMQALIFVVLVMH